MKIAVVCDWLVTIAGAERVLNDIFTCYPNADLFSLVDFLKPDERSAIANKKAHTSFLQKIPFAKKYYRHFLPFMPLAVEQFDLSQYDLVISSSHAVAKGVLTGVHQKHISYVHTPMRYAWDLQHQYLKESGLDKRLSGYLARYMLHRLRLWDFRSAQGVDHFIANSHFIKRRIEKTYRREATVIYPPVDLSRFTLHQDKSDFYVTASRLVPYKRIDAIVESFKLLPHKKLFVIGDGPEFKKIKKKAPANVTLLGYQSQEILIDYLKRAKAFIFAAEEDFGIVPLEAQACGTPVIAFGKGGALETVRSIEQREPTGLFFAEQTPAAIAKAINQFEGLEHPILPDHCANNAKKFSRSAFRDKFISYVDSVMEE